MLHVTAWDVLEAGVGRVEALVAGCEQAEQDEGYTTVGYGGSPDEQGETTLDAMVMDGYVSLLILGFPVSFSLFKAVPVSVHKYKVLLQAVSCNTADARESAYSFSQTTFKFFI